MQLMSAKLWLSELEECRIIAQNYALFYEFETKFGICIYFWTLYRALDIPNCDFTFEDGQILSDMKDTKIRQKLNKILQLRGALK